MLKKLIAVFLILSLAFTVASCGGNEPDADTTIPEPTQPAPENVMDILDKDGAKIGEIDARASCTAMDGGIFYSVFELQDSQKTGNAYYRFYNTNSKQDVYLGTLEGQGYEAYFTRTELDGIVYTLAVVGAADSDAPIKLVLLALDPGAGTMKTHVVSENGFPYASMAVSNGKLLIMNHEMTQPRTDKVYAFDPANETITEALSFSSATDSLRGVSAAKDGFYLLRLKINNGGENEMFLDRYDNGFGKVSEQSVNEALVKATMEVHGIMSRQDALNELGMYLAGFSVEDGRYLFYENFGLTRVILDLQTGDAVLVKEDLYSLTVGSGAPYLYRMDYDPENVPEPEITGVVGAKLVQLDFKPAEPYKLIKDVSHSASGTWLVRASDGGSVMNSTSVLYVWTES